TLIEKDNPNWTDLYPEIAGHCNVSGRPLGYWVARSSRAMTIFSMADFLLTRIHDHTGIHLLTRKNSPRPHLAREPRRLPAAARADRAVAWLLLRPAARAVRYDAGGVDARVRRRSHHHRAVRTGGNALHAEIHLGAVGGRAACAAVHARV